MGVDERLYLEVVRCQLMENISSVRKLLETFLLMNLFGITLNGGKPLSAGDHDT